MRYLGLAGLLVTAATACSDRSSPLEPLRTIAPTRTGAAQVVPEPVNDNFTTDVCGFTVLVHAGGKIKPIALPGDRLSVIFPAAVSTFTNPGNGKTETLSMTGTFHIAFLPDGGVEQVMTGRNIFADPELGLLLIIGNFRFIVDGEGNVVQPLHGTGQTIDLCAILS